jgi:3-dehydroquinate dehydratase
MRQQRPALAFTSEPLAPLMEIIHTPQDSPEIIDPAQLAATAVALRDLVVALANSLSWPA